MDSVVVLNQYESTSEHVPGENVMADMRKTLLQLKSNFISEDGTSVLYNKMAESQLFKQYRQLASQLKHLNVQEYDEVERKAFFINLYNCQMMDALASQQNLPQSPLKVEGMWSKFAYNVGGQLYTLDEIEHGILRCNKGHPSKNGPIFTSPDDPRIKVALETLDPRIHFALNCGAKSCPPIRIYKPENLDRQLNMAAASFCNQDIEVLADKKTVQLSKLLLWYKSDFGQSDRQVLHTLSGFVTNDELKVQIEEVIRDVESEEKIVFRDYDWTLNSSQ